ncbi:DUF4393 domain-containing protein [Anthropogastromicrobium aceti]|uniref:DUF4393 domain-containing protein n=1 Tax=Anthropogastromicrobium aceti TaxID=2981768 RepID=A0AAE3E3S9_9FIRM|nr:DUF4393 domain-containing protein [Anthropogastromicrobium aceti]MCC2220881.1 DUF4393 domain-containing protein [Anthropogastromicrobium aceti]
MSEETTTDISVIKLPKSVDKAVKNLTDEPTKNIGHTFGDIWYLVFGRFSHAADKRRIKYDLELKQYQKELTEKMNAIPDDEKQEPSLQVTAQALENSKYCISEPELREMFVNLISGSMDRRVSNFVHPSFPEIIKQMSPLDAEIISGFKKQPSQPIANFVLRDKISNSSTMLDSYLYFDLNTSHSYVYASSISSLERFGLLSVDFMSWFTNDSHYEIFSKWSYYQHLKKEYEQPGSNKFVEINKGICSLTPLGHFFVDICIS